MGGINIQTLGVQVVLLDRMRKNHDDTNHEILYYILASFYMGNVNLELCFINGDNGQNDWKGLCDTVNCRAESTCPYL